MTTQKKIHEGPVKVAQGATALVLALILLVSACAVVGPRRGSDISTSNTPESLDAMLEPYLARFGLPALGAAVVKDGAIIAIGAVGTRRAGTQIPVTVNDRFHLGSDTKAMTALLAAIFVEEGKLRWDSTVAEIFPELTEKMNAGVRKVTLEQLLSHTSGMPSDNSRFGELLSESMLRGEGNLDELRYWLVSEWVSEPLVSESGKVFAYSNMGYTIAGAMVERVGGKSWEELVTERVFVPLRLRSAGFGPQASLGKVDAPLGHEIRDGKLKPMLAGPNGDNPLILGPAGTSHMSLVDFAAWAAWNVGEGKRGPALVRPETLRKLHTPVITMPVKKDAAPGTPSRGKYALGWGEVGFDWSNESFLYHGGSNTKNLAHILLQPKRDFGIVLMTNVSGKKADQAFLMFEEALYRKFAASK
jgi:CubicO group peptidase (beta-lactamase class C family)